MVSLNPDLLEEVKNVLIPADMLRIEDRQVIGKGGPAYFLLYCFLLPWVGAGRSMVILLFCSGHFGTVYHGYLIDSNKQETHCAVKSLNSTNVCVLKQK